MMKKFISKLREIQSAVKYIDEFSRGYFEGYEVSDYTIKHIPEHD